MQYNCISQHVMLFHVFHITYRYRFQSILNTGSSIVCLSFIPHYSMSSISNPASSIVCLSSDQLVDACLSWPELPGLLMLKVQLLKTTGISTEFRRNRLQRLWRMLRWWRLLLSGQRSRRRSVQDPYLIQSSWINLLWLVIDALLR